MVVDVTRVPLCPQTPVIPGEHARERASEVKGIQWLGKVITVQDERNSRKRPHIRARKKVQLTRLIGQIALPDRTGSP
jgi:hypothetical protein